LNKIRHRWVTTWFAFEPEDLIVHSSFDRFEGFRGSLGGAIQTLQDAVGPEGALLMLRAPTAPRQ
jgi:aminoglycoside N3'-acetyltransferase